MRQYQPVGFQQRHLSTKFGQMVYSVPDFSFYPQVNSQPTPLVFLHSLGGGSSAYEWSKVYPSFATTHQVIAPDLIGWGDSSHPRKTYEPQDYFDIVELLLKRVAVSPAWVVASSLTAGLMIRLAIQKPHLFQGLFLVSPSGYRDFQEDYQEQLSSQLVSLPGLDKLIYALGAANEWAVQNFLEQFLFADASRLNQEIISAYLASALKPNAEYAALASLRGDLCFDLSQYMEQLQTPTVFLWGAQSRFSRSQQGKRLAQLNPNVIRGFHVVSRTGVLPHLENPAPVISLLSYYLHDQGKN